MVDRLTAAGEAGNIVAMAHLARLYDSGVAVAAGPEVRDRWLSAAVEAGRGDPQYMLVLARLHTDMTPCLYDVERAQEYYRMAVDAGSVPAMVEPDRLLLDGRLAPREPGEAEALLQRAAATGSLRGMYELGSLLALGRTQEEEIAAGLDWLERAAAGGLPDAMIALGRIHRMDTVVEADLDRAREWFRQAAAGDPRGFMELGRLGLVAAAAGG